MPVTYYKIATVTVATATSASIEFTSIPQTYTDLLIKLTARTDRASINSDIYAQFNNRTTANYSFERFYTSGAGAVSDGLANNASGGFVGFASGASATSNTFGAGQIYIGNYTSSTNKSFFGYGAVGANSTTPYIENISSLWNYSPAEAITSIKLLDYNSANFVLNSTATLYGIKNS